MLLRTLDGMKILFITVCYMNGRTWQSWLEYWTCFVVDWVMPLGSCLYWHILCELPNCCWRYSIMQQPGACSLAHSVWFVFLPWRPPFVCFIILRRLASPRGCYLHHLPVDSGRSEDHQVDVVCIPYMPIRGTYFHRKWRTPSNGRTPSVCSRVPRLVFWCHF